MKKKFLIFLLTILTMLACAVGFSACGEQSNSLTFKTLTVDGTKVTGVVSNDTTEFSFTDEVVVSGKVKYIITLDKYGTQKVVTKTVPLSQGYNIVYLFEMVGDKVVNNYKVTIRRRSMFDVTFDANGGTDVEKQVIEEDSFAIEPQTTREGYTLAGWNYDFATPITRYTHITAIWNANTDTKYTVNYYLQNYGDNDYTLHETVDCVGTTDASATAEIKEYEHFSCNASNSTINGNIVGDGSLILSVYYTRNNYRLSVDDSSAGSITNAGEHPYGEQEFTTTATPHVGYNFLGWYHGEELLSADTTYTFTVDKNVTAKFALKEEVSNFNLNSTTETCEITGVKDKTVTEIVIPDYVTSIGANAFKDCSNLTSIEIPNSVTSIGEDAFNGCSSLTSIEIPDGVTSIASSAFSGCLIENITCSLSTFNCIDKTKIKSVVITSGDSVDSSVFNGCSSLTSVVIPDSVTSIGDYAFKDCSNLTSIEIPNGVTSIGNSAFYNCSSLTSIEIPNGVTSIGYEAFYNCSSLTSVTIPDSVTSIGDSAFFSCIRLTSVTIGNSVTSIGAFAFRDCSSLTRVVIGSGVTSIGYAAFRDCSSLTSVTIPDSVTSIGYEAFYNCSSLTSIEIPNGVTSIGNSAFYNCSSLSSITIPNGVTSIGYDAFYNCSSLTSIEIPNGVTSIGAGTFNGCSSLEEMTIPFVGDSKKTTRDTYQYPFGYIFGTYSYEGATATYQQYYGSSTSFTTSSTYYIPTSLKKVTVTGGDILRGAFSYCSSLTSVVILDSVTSIGEFAFQDCSSLTSIEIPDSVTNIGIVAFGNCTSLTSIEIPDSVTGISDMAFFCCISLTSVTIGNSVTSIDGAFRFCSNLTSITIPDSVTSIGDYAFQDCSSLTCVTIGKGVTSIGNSAFYGCSSLTSITIPESVTSVGKSAFTGCFYLTIILKDTSTWYLTTSPTDWENKTGGTRIAETALVNDATIFKSTDYYFYKL